MIWVGIVFFAYFLYWFFWKQKIEADWLFLLLSISIFFKALKIFHEWYYFHSLKLEKDKTPKKDFTVDVFTTYCPGEPKDMVKNTLLAIKNIHYPHGTFLCCEGPDGELEEFCQAHDIHYIFRTERTDAKAGNINNGLKQSQADLILILDPDHAPFPEFIDETIGQFNDDRLGFVQIVQSYGNQKESFVARGAAEQTYQFYGPLQIGMNGRGTAQAIGANCFFRREALDSIGGHAAGLCEDQHTSMLLHSKGWKSIYLPKVLSKGVTPSTFSGFFKQQLKWSRGSFDLLFRVYPKIFSKLNWKQKIHYATMPLYFLTGLITFIDFIIPILSLITSSYPVVSDLFQFAIAFGGFGLTTWLIRQRSKQFLLEEHEKTIIWTSTALIASIWWAYLKGLLLAITGKKVPYIPSEKQYTHRKELTVQIPNLFVILISVVSIIYGLKRDFTPFSMIMAGFALINISLLLTTFIQTQSSFIDRLWFVIMEKITLPLQKFIVRISGKHALFFILIIIGAEVFFSLPEERQSPTTEFRIKNMVGGYYNVGGNYNGIYSTTREVINEKGNFINSIYVPWGDNPFPYDTIRKMVDRHNIPMITWEPWASSFARFAEDSLMKNEKGVCKAICEGRFDFYLRDWVKAVKSFDTPIFLRFAHEPGNPQYGWSNNTAEDYILSWQYVVKYFRRYNVHNVVWVWNPWRDFEKYYPGNNYVDWIGLTTLNYGSYKKGSYWLEFEAIYRWLEFYTNILKKPVMLAEFGSTSFGGDNKKWFEESKNKILDIYPEINAVVYFNSDIDNYWPGITRDSMIDWTFEGNKSIYDRTVNYSINSIQHREKAVKRKLPAGIKGVNYEIKNEWRYNYKPITRNQLDFDIARIKELGCNTVSRTFGDIYDYNVLNVLGKNEINVIYGLYNDIKLDYTNPIIRDSMVEVCLKQVQKSRSNRNILCWKIGNHTHQDLNYYFTQPYLYYVRDGYLQFVNKLAKDIKAMDNRPVIVELESDLLDSIVESKIPHIDGIGLVVSDTFPNDYIIQKPFYISSFGNYKANNMREFRGETYVIEGNSLEKNKKILNRYASSNGIVYDHFYQHNFITKTWCGLVDEYGNKTVEFDWYSAVNKNITLQSQAVRSPSIINNNFPYFEEREYLFSTDFIIPEAQNVVYEWVLCDEDVVEIKRYTGKEVKITIPKDHRGHIRIYLNVIDKEKKDVYQNSKPLILG